MKIIESTKLFYKEASENLFAKSSALSPIIKKISLLSTLLAYPTACEKVSRFLAKRTVSLLALRLPHCATNHYHLWCHKQAEVSMQKLEPLLATNPYLSHTLLLMAAANEPDPFKRLKTGFASLHHLFQSACKSLADLVPQISFFSSILATDCKEHRTQIVDHVLIPLVEKTYGTLIQQITLNTLCGANLLLISSLASFALSKILTPKHIETTEKLNHGLHALQWGMTAYLYGPLVYHGVRVINEIGKTYLATKTNEKKLNFLSKQIAKHSNAPNLPPASIKAMAILLATIR